MEALKNLQTDFMKKTGHRLGGFEISETGKININPQTKRIPDLKHPINTKLRETLKGLEIYKMPGEKPTKITNAFDVAMQNAATVKDRINIFKKYRGTSELANSRYIKALSSIPRLKKLIKPLIAGTIGAAGVTTLSQAGETGVVDKAKSWPIEHPWLTGAGAAGTTATTLAGSKLTKADKLKSIRQKTKSGLGKIFRTLGTKAGALPWAAWTVTENLKSGKSLAESVVDPWVGAELMFPSMFKENVSKITKNKALRKFLSLGYKIPGTAFKVGKVTSPLGLGLTTLSALRGMPEEPSYIREAKQRQKAREEDYTRGEHYASGGLTRTVAPGSGPVSQGPKGLAYLKKYGNYS